ncbi:MAG TPA: hypothetical protein VNS34_04790 [Rhizobiaceae bacterium]|nr:hypothetical protein [Rhizobiaceae bacterium]
MHLHSHNHPGTCNVWHGTLYGRRVEMDRSWTVYHVFTGVPADLGSGAMTGLNREDATDKMMSLNRRSDLRRPTRSSPCTSAQPHEWARS